MPVSVPVGALVIVIGDDSFVLPPVLAASNCLVRTTPSLLIN